MTGGPLQKLKLLQELHPGFPSDLRTYEQKRGPHVLAYQSSVMKPVISQAERQIENERVL